MLFPQWGCSVDRPASWMTSGAVCPCVESNSRLHETIVFMLLTRRGAIARALPSHQTERPVRIVDDASTTNSHARR